jgi:hypothetical protein
MEVSVLEAKRLGHRAVLRLSWLLLVASVALPPCSGCGGPTHPSDYLTAGRRRSGGWLLRGAESAVPLRCWWQGVSGGLGLSMQESGGWANLPATTRPLQRVQPEATQASITHGQPGPGWPVEPLVSAGRADGVQ